MLNRNESYKLLLKFLKNQNLIKHSISVEACMSFFADHFNEDKEKWSVTGLLHDLDYEMTEDKPEIHGLKSSEILKDYDVDDDVLYAIKSHNSIVPLNSLMDKVLYSVDPVTGFIIACALMHPDKKIASLDLKFMKKRFKSKGFARGASREQMLLSETNFGISLDDFLLMSRDAMKEISDELGL